MNKKSREKLKYFENEKSCQGKIKNIVASSCQKLPQNLECTLNYNDEKNIGNLFDTMFS